MLFFWEGVVANDDLFTIKSPVCNTVLKFSKINEKSIQHVWCYQNCNARFEYLITYYVTI